MKILFVCNFFAPHIVGGAEIVAERLLVEMGRRGHEVAVFAGRQPDTDTPHGYLDIEQGEGFPVYRIAMRSMEPAFSAFWHEGGLAFHSVLCHEKPDIVHFHNVIGLGGNLIPIAREFGCATIVTLHDYWGICHRNTLLLDDETVCRDHEQCQFCLSHFVSDGGVARPIRLRRDYLAHCLEMSDALVSPSRALAATYEAVLSGKKVSYRSNGVELAKFAESRAKSHSPEACIRFIFVGYLGEHKGVNVLLDAISELSSISAYKGRWQLSILGAGHLQKHIEKTIGRLPDPSVEYLGKLPRSRLPQILGEHDVMVLPSIWPENESVALLEAVAVGMAQIATHVGGNPDLVESGKSGFLVEPGNASALVKAMIAFIEQPGLASLFGSRNEARRKKFSASASFDGYERDYRKLIKVDDCGSDATPLVICGSGWPDLATTNLVNSFSSLAVNVEKPRFIPVEWASATDWETASVFWGWTCDGDRAFVRRALNQGVPVVLDTAHELSVLAKLAPSMVFTYHNSVQAAAVLDVLCSKTRARKSAGEGAKLTATLLKLLDSGDAFTLKSELESP